MFDNLREDWITYERDIWRQGLWVMAVYRFGRWRYGFRTPDRSRAALFHLQAFVQVHSDSYRDRTSLRSKCR